MTKIGVGVEGANGHQIEELLKGHKDAELVATACAEKNTIAE